MLRKNYDVHKKKERHVDEANEYLRLKSRYESKPFHERNFTLFRFSTIGGWASNVVSGITESAKVFAFAIGIIGSVAFGSIIALVLTIIAIIGIELTHRFIARSYFKEYVVNNGHTREQNGNLAGMVICLLISASLSVAGQFDVLRILMNPPQIAEVKEVQIDHIQNILIPIVEDAKERTENYYKRRNYKGRLAQIDKFKYREYEDHAKSMEDSLMRVVLNVPKLNAQAKEEARAQYLQDKVLYEEEVQTKGIGLVFVTIPAILLMYFCLWYEEKYLKRKKDHLEEIYGVAIEDAFPSAVAIPQARIPIDNNSIDTLQLAQYLTNLLQQPSQNGHLNNGKLQSIETVAIDSNNDEFNSNAQKKANELLQYVATRKGEFTDDKYTILHFSFKNGQPKRYTRDRVDWFVKHYEEQVAIAIDEKLDKDIEINRRSKLIYWKARQVELYKKLGTGVEQLA